MAILIYFPSWFRVRKLAYKVSGSKLNHSFAQSAGAVEYTDCTSAEG